MKTSAEELAESVLKTLRLKIFTLTTLNFVEEIKRNN